MEYELYHHGIKGMRWGIRRTRAQLSYDDSSNGTKRRSIFSRKKRNREEDEVDIETKKKKVLKSRSAKQLYDNADLFSTAELQSAYNRLQLERNISNLIPAKVNKGQQFVKSAVSWGRTINDVADTGTKMYNSFARIHNSLSETGRSNPWPLINNDQKKKDKD